MNQELNVSIELSTVATTAAEHVVAIQASPLVLDEALLAQIAGGLSACGPNGTW